MIPRKGKCRTGSALAVIAVLILGGLAWPSVSLAQEQMSYAEFTAKLAEHKVREQRAKDASAQVEKEIADLRAQVQTVQAKVKAVWDEFYALVGTDEAGYRAFLGEVDQLMGDARGLAGLSVEELWNRREDIQRLEGHLKEMQASKISLIPDAGRKLEELDGMVQRIKERVPRVYKDKYTVVRNDNLWKISGKKEIYGDPVLWPRIFVHNRDKIRNPDMIHPRQVLDVPRGVAPGQYLVQRGETLKKISGYATVYGDPTKWVRIYEANRDLVAGDRRVYPGMVLVIPSL